MVISITRRKKIDDVYLHEEERENAEKLKEDLETSLIYADSRILNLWRPFSVVVRDGFIVKLKISKELKEFPKLIFNFKNLIELHIENMRIKTLPRQIDQLTRLVHLNLRDCFFEKVPDSIGNLPYLRKLDLSAPFFTIQLKAIKTEEIPIFLRGKRIRSLPESMGKLKFLRRLDLSYQNISELPQSLENLTNLRILRMEGNILQKFPSEIAKLVRLKELNLARNQIKEIPEYIGNLTMLRRLYLENNPIGSLPDSLGKLKKLRRFHVSRCELSSLPKSIGELQNLDMLILHNNMLQTLPDSFYKLRKLHWLDLGHNLFKKIPEVLGKTKKVQKAVQKDLFGGDSGAHYNEIPYLENLKTIYFRHNKLLYIPENFGNLVNLRNLFLSYNQLTEIPYTFVNLKKLKVLETEDNPWAKYFYPFFSRLATYDAFPHEYKRNVEYLRNFKEFMFPHIDFTPQEEKRDKISVWPKLNELGWKYLKIGLKRMASMISELLEEYGSPRNDEEIIAYAKDMRASVLAKSNEIEELRRAIKLFEQARAISPEYYSRDIYNKTQKKLKILEQKGNSD